MSMRRANKHVLGVVFLAMVMAVVGSGCAVGTTRLKVAHGELASIADKQEGTILVKCFVDARIEKRKPFIGNKRNGFGMVLGHVAAPEGVEIDMLLTQYFAEALEEAGYKTVIDMGAGAPESGRIDAVVSGEITTFWLDLYMAVWHNVKVNITLSDATGENVLWERLFHGEETHILWLGIKPELEVVINQALTKALNEAAAAFAAEEFASKIPRRP